MTRTVRITKECAGRPAGHEETLADESLAQAWVDAGQAEFIDEQKRQGAAPEPSAQAPAGPPKDRMIRRPARRK